MVSTLGRTELLLLLLLSIVLFSWTCAAEGTPDEVISLQKPFGNPKSRPRNGALNVDELEVGPSWRIVGGASDPDSNKHPDLNKAKLAKESTWVVSMKAEVTGSVENAEKANPANKSRSAVPPAPPPVETRNGTAKPSPSVNTSSVSPSPPGSPPDAGKAPPTHGGACDRGGPVIGLLAPAGGEDGLHEYILNVKNVGKSKLDVSVQTPYGWKVNAEGLTLPKGQNKSITVSVTDNEVEKHAAKFNITWRGGDCYVDVPAQDVPGDSDHSSYSAFLNAPGTAALLLGGSLVFVVAIGVASVWGCLSWRAQAQRRGDAGDTKYQELEMAATDTKQGEEEGSPSADGWDEVWEDDDWQDTEAGRTSSSALTLSSAGLNSRRANKDGWDSSWDD